MPRPVAKVKSIRKDYNLEPYYDRLLKELLETGEFQYEVDIIKAAILNLYKDYEAKGKLKPSKSAELTPEEQELVEMARKGEIQPDMEKTERKVKR